MAGSDYSSNERWYDRKGDDLAHEVYEIGTQLEKDDDDRRERTLDFLRLYQGSEKLNVGAWGRSEADSDTEYDLDYGLVQMLCDTAHAEIAGRQKPTGKCQTYDADWKVKRRAKKLEKWFTGQLHQQNGIYLNLWEMMESCFLDSTIMRAGVVKVCPNLEENKVEAERHFFHELHVDPNEAVYGNPQNLFHVYTVERDLLISQFCNDPDMSTKKKNQIKLAIEMAPEGDKKYEASHYGRVAKTVKVVEAWRLPPNRNEPGKHVFCIENKLLHEEDWEIPEFPFVVIRWNPDRVGWDSRSLAEEVETLHAEVNYNAQKLQERFRICGAKRTYIEEGSVDTSHMQDNEAESFIEYTPGTNPPKETNPSPINEAEVQWMRDQLDMGFRRSGISEMRASARKEPGVDSGVAIRTINDMQTARFALKAKAYENAFVQLFRQFIYCAKAMAEAGHEVEIKYKKDRIKWSEVELPEDHYDITIAPTSSLPNDPAGRMQMANELLQMQLIGAETYKHLINMPDLEKEMNNETSQMQYVEMVIDKMLDGEEYIAPDPLCIPDQPGAMMQAVRAYTDAVVEEAPETALQPVRQWIGEVQSSIKKAEEAAVAAQAQLQNQVSAQAGPPPEQGVA